MSTVTPIIGLVLYGLVILGAAHALRIYLVASISGAFLLIYSGARCLWESTRLFTPPSQAVIVLSALSDGVAGISFYAFIASLLLRTGCKPRSGSNPERASLPPLPR